MKRLLLILISVAACSGWQLHSQTSNDVTATVTFGNGETATVTDFSAYVGIHPSELVTVRFQFPASAAGEPVVADVLDRGSSSLDSSLRVADPDGSLTFTFLGTSHPGRNRVNVRVASAAACLQFWVMDPNKAQTNPPNFAAVSHN